MSSTRRTLVRRLAVVGALVALPLVAGCGGKGFSTDGLAQASTRSVGAMDGFVFVPSRARQTSAGTAIPNAIIKVYVLPRTPGDTPVVQTQADAAGNYKAENLPLNVPLVVVVTDPFDPARQMLAVISFDKVETKTRNVDPVSTVAAAVIVQQAQDSGGVVQPFSDSQVAAIEQVAQQVLDTYNSTPTTPGQPAVPVDITLNLAALTTVVHTAVQQSFGSFEVSVYSDPTVQATVILNGATVGTVTTAVPVTSRQTVSGNTVTVQNVPVGVAILKITAGGFLDDVINTSIVAGQKTHLDRTLVRVPAAGQNLPVVIVTTTVTPQTLPFQGGTVSLAAVARDPEGQAVSGTASIYLQQGTGGQQLLVAVPLTANGDTFSGTATVPGNGSTVTAAYVVMFEFTDGANRPVIRRSGGFQVNGLSAPPLVPASR